MARIPDRALQARTQNVGNRCRTLDGVTVLRYGSSLVEGKTIGQSKCSESARKSEIRHTLISAGPAAISRLLSAAQITISGPLVAKPLYPGRTASRERSVNTTGPLLFTGFPKNTRLWSDRHRSIKDRRRSVQYQRNWHVQ